ALAERREEAVAAGGRGLGARPEPGGERRVARDPGRQALGARAILRPEARVDEEGVARVEAEAVQRVRRERRVELAQAEQVAHGVAVLPVAEAREARVGGDRRQRL